MRAFRDGLAFVFGIYILLDPNIDNMLGRHHHNTKAVFFAHRPAFFLSVFSAAQRSGVGGKRQVAGCGGGLGTVLV